MGWRDPTAGWGYRTTLCTNTISQMVCTQSPMWCKTLRPGSPDKQESQISLRYLAPCIAAVSDQWGNKRESSRMRNGTTSRTSKALFLKNIPHVRCWKGTNCPGWLKILRWGKYKLEVFAYPYWYNSPPGDDILGQGFPCFVSFAEEEALRQDVHMLP